jgi:hypothetical protein
VRPDHPRPIAESSTLSAWRKRPWRYHARHFADLYAVLGELTLGVGKRARSVVAAIVQDHASDRIWQLALELADHLAYARGDLPVAWAALAGARYHALAAVAVAQRLYEYDQEDSWRRSALAAGWVRLAVIGTESVLRRSEIYLDQLCRPETPAGGRWSDGHGPGGTTDPRRRGIARHSRILQDNGGRASDRRRRLPRGPPSEQGLQRLAAASAAASADLTACMCRVS